MTVPGPLPREELSLLLEALRYQSRRVREPVEAVRLRGLVDRLEEMLLASVETPAVGGALRLSPPEQEVLLRQVDSYCEELTRRGASLAGRDEARRLRAILSPLREQASPLSFWRRLFRRRR